MSESATTDALDGLDPDETVWIVLRRRSSDPSKYHTKSNCPGLKRAYEASITTREARRVVPQRELCDVCAGTAAPNTPAQTDCPYCGAEDIVLPEHLPCEGSDAANRGGA